MKSTLIPDKTHDYYHISGQIDDFLWYQQPILTSAIAAIILIILHYSFWSYWLAKAIDRRFSNPHNPFLRKRQTYWITPLFTLIGLGFVLNIAPEYKDAHSLARYLYVNFALFQGSALFFMLGLTLAISPRRQHLIDWSRYEDKNWLKGLIFGEKSPSTLAIALNLLIMAAIVTPAILFSPLREQKLSALLALVVSVNMTLIYAALLQWLLLGKQIKKGIIALAVLGIVAFASTLGLVIVNRVLSMGSADFTLLFTLLSSAAVMDVSGFTVALAVMTQWVAMLGMGFLMTKQLKKLGISQSAQQNAITRL